MAYLRGLSQAGASFTDVQDGLVGGQPATILTATATESLDGSLGCQDEGLDAPDCYGQQEDLLLRMAVMTVGDKTLLIWERIPADASAEVRSADAQAFARMLDRHVLLSELYRHICAPLLGVSIEHLRWLTLGGKVRIAVRDTVLFFDVAGEKLVPDRDSLRERPTLVLVHGGPGGDHAAFKPVLDTLADVAQLIYLDLRGHGRSEAGTPADWTLATWADDLAAFCDVLEISAPVVLGASWGVAVVGTYAARHPEQPGKLILSAGPSRTSQDIELAAVERILGAAARDLGERFWADPTPASEDAYGSAVWPFAVGIPSENLTLSRICGPAPGLPEHWDVGEYRTFDLRPGLANVRCPTLILAGEHDPVCPKEFSQEMAQAIGPELCRLEILREGKHTLFWEAPESITRIRDFLLN